MCAILAVQTRTLDTCGGVYQNLLASRGILHVLKTLAVASFHGRGRLRDRSEFARLRISAVARICLESPACDFLTFAFADTKGLDKEGQRGNKDRKDDGEDDDDDDDDDDYDDGGGGGSGGGGDSCGGGGGDDGDGDGGGGGDGEGDGDCDGDGVDEGDSDVGEFFNLVDVLSASPRAHLLSLCSSSIRYGQDKTHATVLGYRCVRKKGPSHSTALEQNPPATPDFNVGPWPY